MDTAASRNRQNCLFPLLTETVSFHSWFPLPILSHVKNEKEGKEGKKAIKLTVQFECHKAGCMESHECELDLMLTRICST